MRRSVDGTVPGQRAEYRRNHAGPPPGAHLSSGGVSFCVWAPDHDSIDVVIEGEGGERILPLQRYAGGYFSAVIAGLGEGTLYRYRIDRGQRYPDPCTRFQPQGPHGPSVVVDPGAYAWGDGAWKGLKLPGQVLYEMHIGAFTREGTFDAAARELGGLRRLGVTAVELMPVAECPGRWNWGYDGVDLFAPYHIYGGYDALKRFVDTAHSTGLGVILDVVYNHLGPDGCYLQAFSKQYFSTVHETEWGNAINFDGPGAPAVRGFFTENARYWIRDFHLDDLRFDATQNIYDKSSVHILSEITRECRRAAPGRSILLIAENESQQDICLRPAGKGGYGFDAVWNDDFHHAARVALTGMAEAYLMDYRGRPQEFISAAKRCFLYQGQYYGWQKKRRGSVVSDEDAASFVIYLQNHDQIANHLKGERLASLAPAPLCRALTAVLLLAPQTPLLFMGQEYGARTPFNYFADIESLAAQIYDGRKKFVAQFPSYMREDRIRQLPDPARESTYYTAKLDRSGRADTAPWYLLHRDLLALRRTDRVVAAQARHAIDGAVLSEQAFILRYFGGAAGDRLLAVNLGNDFTCAPLAEPLLAAPSGGSWKPIWSSDGAPYGGTGAPPLPVEEKLFVPKQSAVFFRAPAP